MQICCHGIIKPGPINLIKCFSSYFIQMIGDGAQFYFLLFIFYFLHFTVLLISEFGGGMCFLFIIRYNRQKSQTVLFCIWLLLTGVLELLLLLFYAFTNYNSIKILIVLINLWVRTFLSRDLSRDLSFYCKMLMISYVYLLGYLNK